jgi:uncharacterized membrane protein
MTRYTYTPARRRKGASGPELALVVAVAIAFAFAISCGLAWLLQVILSWFDISLGFWKCLVIIVFVNLLVGRGHRAST